MTWATRNLAVRGDTPVIREGEDEFELKMKFAKILYDHPEKKLTAGYMLFPGPENYGRAMQAALWNTDPFVIAEIERLMGDGNYEDREPTESQVRKEVLDHARATIDAKVKLDGYRLYADMRGMLRKDMAVNVGTINILKVPTRDISAEDDADFERRFEAQQLKLVRDARSTRPE